MATIKRAVKRTKKGVKKKPKLSLKLPTTKNKPSPYLGDYSFLFYGPKKIGKTSLAAMFDDAFIIACEPGTKGLEVYSRPANSWEELRGYVDLVLAGGHNYKTVVIDTVDRAYEYAYNKVCKSKMISNPTEENDFGQTWREIRTLIHDLIEDLIKCPDIGVVLISHEVEKEIEQRDGSKIDRFQPSMPAQAMKVVEAIVDIIGNYTYVHDKRVMMIDGSEYLVAGSRLKNNFKYPDGTKIKEIPMGESEEEAYSNLTKAFSNELSPPEAKKPLKRITRRTRKE